MKRLLAFFAVIGMLTFNVSNIMAQNTTEEPTGTEQTVSTNSIGSTPSEDELSGFSALHQQLKIKFIEGGAGFMALVLICLIFGLALVIERIIYLNLASTNTEKLLAKFEETLKNEGVEAAKELCRNTRGPIASIFYQGLLRMDEGLEVVEKSVVAYGGVQTSLLEKGLSWVALFIAAAPMLGFLGTIIGMVEAFDAIETAGDMSPTVVAGGIKVALLTTLLGLIVALVLQIFYNYLLSKIDSLVADMEDASISFVDVLTQHNRK